MKTTAGFSFKAETNPHDVQMQRKTIELNDMKVLNKMDQELFAKKMQ